MNKLANQEAYDAVKDMHQGLHIAMDRLLIQRDKEGAEQILHELDHRMKSWLEQTKVAK